MRAIFTNIYNNNLWQSDESVSGVGSDSVQTKIIKRALPKLFKEHKIKSMLDIPCGDHQRINKVKKPRYIGADIVKELIHENRQRYPGVEFLCLDLTNDKLPKTELVFVRDCLVHLSYEDIFKAIANIKQSGAKYLLTTYFTNHPNNNDIATGGRRTLDLTKSPFNRPQPILTINEGCTEGDGVYSDKSLGLRLLADID